MNSNRLWIIGSVLVMVLVVAGTAVLGILPQLDAAAKSAIEREAVKQQNAQLALDLEELKAQFANRGEIQEELDDLRLSIPDDIESESFLAQLDKIEDSNKVRVKSAAFTEAAAFVPSVELAESVDPALDVANFYAIPVTITVEGSADRLIDFLGDLQDSTRYYLATDVALQRAEGNGATMTIQGFIFALRNTDGSQDASTGTEGEEPVEETPAPTETPAAPGSTPTPTETPAP